MKIAIVGPTYPYKGGIAQHTTILAHRLSLENHIVRLISWRCQYPNFLYPGEQSVPQGIPEGRPFPSTKPVLDWRRPDSWWRAGRHLVSNDIIIFIHVTPLQVPSYLVIVRSVTWRQAAAPRLISVAHNVLPHESRPGDRFLVSKLLRKMDGVLVHSKEEEARARSLGARATAIGHLAPLLDPAVHQPLSNLKSRDPKRRLLFFGMVRPYKGLDVLLNALTMVPDVQLIVAGEFWENVSKTRRLLNQLNLADRVDIRDGYVAAEAVPRLFQEVDALVLPYRTATSSGNVGLAFAHRVPVIASSVGDIPDHVQHGVNGLLTPPGDQVALGKAIRHLYEPGVLKGLRKGIRQLNVDQIWSSYIAALESLAVTTNGH